MHTDNITALPGTPERPVQQERPDFTPAGFCKRLTAGLDALKIPESERPAMVAEAAGVTIRTARRYLKGDSQPRGGGSAIWMARRLGLSAGWLIAGDGPITEAALKAEREEVRELAEALESNPPWRRRLMERTLTRMANKSPRVQRLLDLHQSGQLSADDFLRLAGR